MLVQSGKPVGVFRTNVWAPRVLLANSNLVGDWANWEQFRKLEAEGLMMYGQMTAGSWIYIGTQGILQGTYETFGAIAKKEFGGTLAGTITLTGGVGGMGGAQPLAVTMNEGVAICVDCRRHPHRPAHRQAIPRRQGRRSRRGPRAWLSTPEMPSGRCRSAWSAMPPKIFPALLERDAPIDIVTDQTSAHDPLSYLPLGHRPRGHEEDVGEGPRLLHRAGPAVDGQAGRGHGRVPWTGVPRSSTTATRSGTRRARPDTTARSTSPVSFPPTSVRSSRRDSGRSAGPHCRATRRTSPPPTRRSSNSSPTTRTCGGGSPWPARRVEFEGLPGTHLLARLRRTPPSPA